MAPQWLNKNEYPFESRFLNLGHASMHYIDQGEGIPVVFVHGTPGWSFEFRHLIKALSGQFRCIAMDHIGFGLSDKPRNYNYNTMQHSQNLSLLISHLKLEDIILVVHDFGGPISLNYAIQNPGNIQSLVLMNTWMWDCSNEPGFIKLKPMLKSPFLSFLYKYLNFSAAVIMPRSFGKRKLKSHIKAHFISPFSNRQERMGPFAFAKSLLNDQNWFGQLWDKRECLKEKDFLFLWGMADPVLSPDYLRKFEIAFPHHRTIKFEDSGHYPHEEEPSELQCQLEKWLVNLKCKTINFKNQ